MWQEINFLKYGLLLSYAGIGMDIILGSEASLVQIYSLKQTPE